MFEPQAHVADSAAPDWIAALSAHSGFTTDPRYSAVPTPLAEEVVEPVIADQDEANAAFEEGRLKGHTEAVEEARISAVERRKLGSALRRLDEDMTARLGTQLSRTIALLCEQTLAPLALDTNLLEARCAKAAALLGERHDAVTLHLCPSDIAALDEDFRAHWHIAADDTLEPGNLVIEGADGGIADGPAEWRAALAEALGLC